MGGPEDLLENLETNLRVKRYNRAKRIIHKLVDSTAPPHLVSYAHSRLLEERLDCLAESDQSKSEIYQEMREWFELEVVDKNVPISSDMVAMMLEAVIQGRSENQQARSVRRYYDLALVRGLEDDVVNSDVYSDDALWRLAQIVPDFAAEEFSSDAESSHQQHQQPQQQQHELEDPSPSPSPSPSSSSPSLPQEQHLQSQPQPGQLEAQPSQDLPPPTLPGIFADVPQLKATVRKTKNENAELRNELLPEGLLALQDALERAHVALKPADSASPQLTPRQRQELIEDSASEAAIARWRKEEGKLKDMGVFSELDPQRPLGALMWQWYAALVPALKQELDECRTLLDRSDTEPRLNDDRLAYAAHLESVPVHQIAANTILHVMSLVAGGKDKDTNSFSADMKLARLSASLGKLMQHEATMAAKREDQRRAKAARKASTLSKRKQKPTDPPVDLVWSSAVVVKLGAMLISRLMETAKISVSRPHPRTKEVVTQLQPAFLHKTVYERGRKVGKLSACPDLVRKLDRSPVGHLIAKRLPMVIEPDPWTDFAKGGYLFYPNPIIRFATGDKVPRDYARAAVQRGDLEQVFSALNALGKTPWRINADILRVQIEAWNSGEPIANLAPRDPKKDVIEKPVDQTDLNAMRKFRQRDTEQNNLVNGYHSQRCFQNFQMEIARAFRHEKMYFPHNVDFRGRAYPIPPYLNHMGADNARALMKFADGKELGHEGLRWLKIHLANVFGYDKASLQEREDFVMNHLAEIYDSTANPLGGQKWWLKSEDAWQTLAACFELKSALESPDPTKFVSTLPIHQDGTCNGLQHYAALGGDAIGARQVNLEPGDRPSDVYTAVADAVRAEVKSDFDAGHPVATLLHGRITRKVVKQPVMTNVYGVTYYGARAQVKKQLEELFPEVKRDDPVDHLTMASYVATKIFKSLGEMFTGAQAIQQWLGECADRISTCVTQEQILDLQSDHQNAVRFARHTPTGTKKAYRLEEGIERLNASKQLFRSSVIWTTPLRLPVVQPYRSNKRKIIPTKLSKLAIREPGTTDPVSKRKQLQGFPPNFIHSLDASHMMLSANKCSQKGITFASIHDSFWTHACDINDMSLILRDAFVDMHSEDIIGRLRHEFIARYKGAMYLAAVDLRSSAGKKISHMQKNRPKKRGEKRDAMQPWQVTELLREKERLRLLESEDPEERKRGEEMVTSGSIFAAEKDKAGVDALAIPTEVMSAKLGEIPLGGPEAEAEAEASVTASDVDDAVDADSDDVEAYGQDIEEDTVAAAVGEDAAASDASHDVSKLKERKPAKKAPLIRKVYVWLPLTFPEVPAKGTFDVRRLKESTYFFH